MRNPHSDSEQVVLVDDAGRRVGVADKASVHGRSTPRHLAFSCYGFDAAGRVLMTRRAATKRAFPLVWTGTCCGHPAPDEPLADAVHRRLDDELGLRAVDLRLMLPDFGYRASDDGPDGGIEEHELCPVFVCTLDGDPRPAPDEVAAWEWWSWERLVEASAAGALSPWARLQVPLLAELVDRPLSR
ncbi:MAG: isopentenyl-diphosphate Delta-isomerase [Pseudonocardia sp.]|nr:isopentenyl-diphosphate Delta-isomerase [Pseudonocardia sp.]